MSGRGLLYNFTLPINFYDRPDKAVVFFTMQRSNSPVIHLPPQLTYNGFNATLIAFSTTNSTPVETAVAAFIALDEAVPMTSARVTLLLQVETGALITGSSLFGSVYYDVDQNNPIVASITDSSNGNLSFSPHLHYSNNSLATFLAVQKDSSPGVRRINGFQSNYGPTRRNNAAQYIASRTFQNQNDGAIAADVIFTETTTSHQSLVAFTLRHASLLTTTTTTTIPTTSTTTEA
eukprot:CAMPEP_0168590214 /NCGR_PEP_ID=MMETSP0420-20121227/6441_1 /TAXON_ID=498008 /ORGANISM="Pessonella sp." /LENGTH=233 /DNA_ID=CAMNT_0008625843 /DNA_START=115 /DNA_END=813 /DNA_ORIENTATION=-